MMFDPRAVNDGHHWLTLVLLVPVVGALLLQPLSRNARGAIKTITVAATLVTGVIVVGLLVNFDQFYNPGPGRLAFQYQEQHAWISAIGASYHVGIDGLSAWLLALDAGVFLLGALVISRRATERLKLFCGLLLLTEAATAGVLLSLDVLLFYVFWEAMLIPLFFLLANYGDAAKRGPATLKFIVYTVAGSLLMLLAIIYLYAQTKGPSFDITAMLGAAQTTAAQGPVTVAILGREISLHLSPAQFAFLAFALAFAIKVPLVPFHTWLPDLYEAAPASTLTFFAGIVSKLGAFGFLRYCVAFFPQETHDFQWLLMSMAALSIVYGAFMALSETDIKRIVAYSSISHLGFIVLGIFALNANGINGSIMQMINHGIIIAALFLIVGSIEQRTATRDLREMSGLEKRMPVLYVLFLIATLAGLGMPGMNSFVGEFSIMLGAFAANPVFAVLAGVGVIFACWYMLRLHQGLMHGPLKERTERVGDLRWGEGLVLVPLVVLMVGIGMYPKPVGDLSRTTVSGYLSVAHATPAYCDGLSAAAATAAGCK